MYGGAHGLHRASPDCDRKEEPRMRKAIVLILALLTLLAVAGGVPQSGFAKECDPSGTWC